MRFLILSVAIFATGQALADYNMNPVGASYKYAKELSQGKTECVIKTMPSTRTQDALSICFAATAAVLIDEFQCHVTKNEKCTEVPNELRTSQLDGQGLEDKKMTTTRLRTDMSMRAS